MRRIPVTLLGRQYILKSDSDHEEVTRVVDFINGQIADVEANCGSADTLGNIVLALLNVSEAYLRLKEERRLEGECVERLERLTERVSQALSGSPAAERPQT